VSEFLVNSRCNIIASVAIVLSITESATSTRSESADVPTANTVAVQTDLAPEPQADKNGSTSVCVTFNPTIEKASLDRKRKPPASQPVVVQESVTLQQNTVDHVLKMLTNVEKERLEVEKERLAVERERLATEIEAVSLKKLKVATMGWIQAADGTWTCELA